MSRENVDIVRTGVESYNSGDRDALIGMSAPDVEWIPLGSLLDGSSYQGHDGIRTFLEVIAEEWDGVRIEVDDFHDVGNRVLMLGRFHARGRASGVEVEHPAAWLFELRSGKVVRMRAFGSQEEALVSSGLAG